MIHPKRRAKGPKGPGIGEEERGEKKVGKGEASEGGEGERRRTVLSLGVRERQRGGEMKRRKK